MPLEKEARLWWVEEQAVARNKREERSRVAFIMLLLTLLQSSLDRNRYPEDFTTAQSKVGDAHLTTKYPLPCLPSPLYQLGKTQYLFDSHSSSLR